MTFEVDVINQQGRLPVDVEDIRKAVIHGLQVERVASAVLSITLVDNASIHELNRIHLGHDYPTDVISFPLEHSGDAELTAAAISDPEASPRPAENAHIEGEIIASVEMARTIAAELDGEVGEELKLYVVHGMLHICGYDDQTDQQKSVMRSRESEILNRSGSSISRPLKP